MSVDCQALVPLDMSANTIQPCGGFVLSSASVMVYLWPSFPQWLLRNADVEIWCMNWWSCSEEQSPCFKLLDEFAHGFLIKLFLFPTSCLMEAQIDCMRIYSGKALWFVSGTCCSVCWVGPHTLTKVVAINYGSHGTARLWCKCALWDWVFM